MYNHLTARATDIQPPRDSPSLFVPIYIPSCPMVMYVRATAQTQYAASSAAKSRTSTLRSCLKGSVSARGRPNNHLHVHFADVPVPPTSIPSTTPRSDSAADGTYSMRCHGSSPPRGISSTIKGIPQIIVTSPTSSSSSVIESSQHIVSNVKASIPNNSFLQVPSNRMSHHRADRSRIEPMASTRNSPGNTRESHRRRPNSPSLHLSGLDDSCLPSESCQEVPSKIQSQGTTTIQGTTVTPPTTPSSSSGIQSGKVSPPATSHRVVMSRDKSCMYIPDPGKSVVTSVQRNRDTQLHAGSQQVKQIHRCKDYTYFLVNDVGYLEMNERRKQTKKRDICDGFTLSPWTEHALRAQARPGNYNGRSNYSRSYRCKF